MGVWDEKRKAYRMPGGVGVRNGVSDILGVLKDGRFLAIEVKGVKGRLTKQQKDFIESVNELGGMAFVARSLTDVINCMKGYIDVDIQKK